MHTLIWIAVVVAVVLVAAAAVRFVLQQRRRRRLGSQFGTEYERSVRVKGSRRDAERELEERSSRRRQLDIRELSPEAREQYAQLWRDAQARFVDVPADAVRDADTLLSSVMRERGYPIADFEQRAADVSVDHADVVENYRYAHAIAEQSARGEAGTEDLRQAMVHYRALFKELLGEGRSVGATVA